MPDVVSPFLVTKKLLVLLSTNTLFVFGVLFCSVNKLVFAIAVKGELGGVNAEAYTAVPFTTLKFEIYPVKGEPYQIGRAHV